MSVLTIARDAAQKSNMRQKHGAVIYSKHPMTSGFNYRLAIPNDGKFSIHAEEMVILKALRRGINLRNCSIIVVRIKKDGEFAISKPCKKCTRLIEEMRIKKVLHT